MCSNKYIKKYPIEKVFLKIERGLIMRIYSSNQVKESILKKI